MRALYRLLGTAGDILAVRRGPGAVMRRLARRAAHRRLARAMR